MSHRSAYVGALAILAFVMGAVVMSLEMLASRYLTPFFGGAITTWGAIISTVLAALAIGYYAGGALADRHPHPARLGLLTLPAAIYMAALPVFAPDFALWTATNVEDIRWGVLAASVVLFCPPLILLGAYSPFIIRLVIRSESHSGRVAGLIYAISTAGSILGTLVTTFYLVPHFGTRAITLGLSAATALCGGTLFALGQMTEAKQVAGHAVSRAVEVAAGVGAVLYLAVALLILSVNGAFAAQAGASNDTGSGAASSSFARGFFQHKNQLAFVESPYNTIIVTEQAPYRSMLFGYRERRYTETRINFTDATRLPIAYTRSMAVALAFTDKAERLLMIGLGGGSTTGYLSHYVPEMQIEVAELDPDVIKLARDYFNVEPSDIYKIAAVDGRLYLNRQETRYDIIMVDAYRGWFVPFHLTTQEFYRLARSRLAPGGVLAQNIERQTLLFDSTVATLKSVFDHVALYKGGYNVVAIAYDGAVKDDVELGVRAAELQARHGFRYPLPDLLKEAMPLDYDETTDPLTDDFAPANMLHLTPRDEP